MNALTAQQAADQIGVSRRTVQRAASDHGIGAKIGRDWIFTTGDIRRLRKVCRNRPGNPHGFAQVNATKREKKS